MEKVNWFLRLWFKIQGKKEYFVETTEDMESMSVYSVFANSPKDAERAFYKKYDLGKGEFIYQISRWFDNCSLPQPVYDFFNGYGLYSDKTGKNY